VVINTKRSAIRRSLMVAVLAGLAPLSCGDSGGGPSILDPTFRNGGMVTTAIGVFEDEAYALAIQADGKLVSAGYSFNSNSQAEFALARYVP